MKKKLHIYKSIHILKDHFELNFLPEYCQFTSLMMKTGRLEGAQAYVILEKQLKYQQLTNASFTWKFKNIN